jgi:hypothetical protein
MSETKNPRGRPPLPEQKRLSEIVRFRVTQAEADALYREAIRERKTLSEHLRERLSLVLGVLQTT